MCSLVISADVFRLSSQRRLSRFFRSTAVIKWLAKECAKDPETGAYSGDMVFAFGAAKFAHNSRGSASSPVWTFRTELSKVCSMVLINEYKTSQLCSSCHTSYLRPGRVKGEKRSLHGVRVCALCRTHWNRDINSALNMLFLFWFQLARDGDRPLGYAPGGPNTKPPGTKKRKGKGKGKGPAVVEGRGAGNVGGVGASRKAKSKSKTGKARVRKKTGGSTSVAVVDKKRKRSRRTNTQADSSDSEYRGFDWFSRRLRADPFTSAGGGSNKAAAKTCSGDRPLRSKRSVATSGPAVAGSSSGSP